ncbi:TetR/AcrR family transcriptional regulator [Cellulomonas sp. PhB143]|uniref:TetR/AcrR family transcriptional regulator n=1 Tax=Cellulomonas sp. PhB143 TaxID=2485186 RepID=UPI000F49A701|nr:TetR/AcrR family transcriptional regulator [Cellulomonas sp. PhB143]ROS75388.1 TetR family transcriptional regulator [Cellulomonas sp. PhB143]
MGTPSSVRPLRADAQRNRDRLLAVARAAFARADDSVPLEGIAREAGVGIGTLYRHFPTREALVEAVYAAELDDLVADAAQLLEELDPEEAMRAWMRRYAGFAAAKRGMIDTLRAGWASGRITTSATRARMTSAVGAILAAGASAGVLRDDVDPGDVITMVLGVFVAVGGDGAGGSAAGRGAESAARTARLLDLIVDAVRAPRG